MLFSVLKLQEIRYISLNMEGQSGDELWEGKN